MKFALSRLLRRCCVRPSCCPAVHDPDRVHNSLLWLQTRPPTLDPVQPGTQLVWGWDDPFPADRPCHPSFALPQTLPSRLCSLNDSNNCSHQPSVDPVDGRAAVPFFPGRLTPGSRSAYCGPKMLYPISVRRGQASVHESTMLKTGSAHCVVVKCCLTRASIVVQLRWASRQKNKEDSWKSAFILSFQGNLKLG